MLIDTHCHLNFKAFNKDLPEVIRSARDNGVGQIIIPGAKLSSSKKAVMISEKYTCCFAAAGIHPHHANEHPSSEKETETGLMEILGKEKVIAVGEIGLDYHNYRDTPPVSENDKKVQSELFVLQLNMALKYSLPVIIHCREAQRDILMILMEFLKEKKGNLKGVFHCFEGDIEYLNKVLSLGFYIGIDGNLTYPDNSKLREVVRLTPLDRILLETDSPYLTPVPYRGSRNEPSRIKFINNEVALLKALTAEIIEKASTQNARTLFRLK